MSNINIADSMTRKKRVNFVCQYGQQVIDNFNTSNTVIRSLRDSNIRGVTYYFKASMPCDLNSNEKTLFR